MRKNELKSLEELKSQYIGVWGPSDGQWLGLDFSYNGHEYRLHTGTMYGDKEKPLKTELLLSLGFIGKPRKKIPNIQIYTFMNCLMKQLVWIHYSIAP